MSIEQPTDLVSIIMPLFNVETYLEETINSIQKQTYPHWEAILVDDGSSDSTIEIAKRISDSDSRVKLMRNSSNQGAARSRNTALAIAKGRYIAYLDSDDYWLPTKLEVQLRHMTEMRVPISFTSYETVNHDGSHRNFIKVDKRVDYKKFLKKPPTCSHTIIFDTDVVNKNLLFMPDLRKRQDAATWLNVLKVHKYMYGMEDVLAVNRKRKDSLSANKLSAVRNTWNLYRNVEKLSTLNAAYCLIWQMTNATIKRIGSLK